MEVRSEWGAGKISFRSGRVLHAQIADLQGEAAFSRMVSAPAGDFRLLPPEAPGTVSIARPWEDVLIDAVRGQESERDEVAESQAQELQTKSLFQMVRGMNLTQKVRFALRCEKEGRSLLIRDGSRAVQFAIISNPRITEGEIAIIASSKTIDEEVLRRIAENREWVKYYPVRLALAGNSKTPINIGIKMLPTLMPQDLSLIAKSKDVSAMIALAARRLILQKG